MTKSIQKCLIVIYLLQCFVITSIEAKTATDTLNISELNVLMQKLSDNVSEIRRDQLNYKIEKDLLKDTYSSNLGKINLGLAIVLGLFTLLGFFGLRDIGALREKYINELGKLKEIHSDLDKKVREVGDFKQDVAELKKEVKEEISNVLRQNEEQNRKIRVIELKEKIASLITSNSNDRALEYIAVAREIAPKETELLNLQGITLFRKDRYYEAELVYKELLSVDPVHFSAITNIPELLLFQKKSEEYKRFKQQNFTFLSEAYEGILLIYFDVLDAYVRKDFSTMESIIKSYIEKKNPKEQKQATGWNFSDLHRFLSTEPESRLKSLLLGLSNHMDGRINGEALHKILGDSK